MPIDIPRDVEIINELLQRHFGIDTSTGQVMWRVVWSDDQFEKRLMPVTDEGLQLLYPEVREVPKYRQWIPHMWVLERLVAVPDMNKIELPTVKLSYEPLFPFHDRYGNPTKPTYQACEWVINLIYAAQGRGNLSEYLKHPEGENAEEAIELKKQRVDSIVQDIFGDETDVSDHLSRKTGVVISNTNNLIKES